MDGKALAKSKRAHTQHLNRRHHPNPKSKSHSSHPNSAGNPSAAAQKPRRQQSGAAPNLPSNWDRYEDEEGLEFGGEVSEANAGASSGGGRSGKAEASDVLVAKSKGADYRYLVDEAKSHYRFRDQRDSSLDSMFCFDGALPAFFREAACSLISVRGDAILSWCNEDKFATEDESRSIPEVPFLSLNLNSLEEQLAKVDLAKRLFIDPDLLPSELQSQSPVASSVAASEKMKMQQTESVRRGVDKLSLDNSSEGEMSKKTGISGSSSRSLPTFTSNQVDSNMSQAYRSSETASPICTTQPTEIPPPDERAKHALFEAGAAEAELDTLLDSFGETQYIDSSSFGSSASSLPSRQRNYTNLPQTPSQGLSSSEAVLNNNIDAFLDNLLEETSSLGSGHTLKEFPEPKQVKAAPFTVQAPLPDKSTYSNSRVSDDFDSWLDTI